jgi:DNA-directed RNA polymerase specialized sigma24 family protein
LSGFEPLDDGRLDRMSDEELVAYVAAAFAAGHYEAGRRAAGMLTWRLMPLVEARVAAKVPIQHCEDVVGNVLESFVKSAFDGKVIRSVRAFIATIAQRRIADFHRDREGDPEQLPLRGEHVGEDDAHGDEESVEDETEAVALRDAIERVLARRKEVHRQVIELYAPEQMDGADLRAKEVVARMQADHGETVSESNVQKIWQRFKEDLENELSAGEDVEASDE